MTEQHRSAINALITDVILDLLADAPEEKLVEVYTLLRGRGPSEPPIPRPQSDRPPALRPSSPPSKSKSGEWPAATVQVTKRAMQRLGHPAKLGEIVAEVHREQPMISKSAVSGALTRLRDSGEVDTDGETRATVYTLLAS